MAPNGSTPWLVGERSLTFCDAELEGLMDVGDAVDVEDVLDELL